MKTFTTRLMVYFVLVIYMFSGLSLALKKEVCD